MKLLHLTLDSPAENLALDEALLETAELSERFPEVLRIWEPLAPLTVVGRSSPVETEVNLEFCRSLDIPILRRCSGGQTIVTGPGCLMYAVLLDYRLRPELRMLENAHQFVMAHMQTAIQGLGMPVEQSGTSDLTLGGRKFSGNSLRCKRNWLVYHGTLLCDFDVELIAKCLGKPIRQPEYRQHRSHLEFLTQLPTTTAILANAIQTQWSANAPLKTWPQSMTRQLAEEKYSRQQWNFKIP
jgi:lipoate-protein ligase A